MTAGLRQFDVIVLGAGAAGLMCAAVAGQRGRRVALLEHNGQPGRKILISGGGRCNFTNLYCGPENFLSGNPHFAKSALALFQPQHFLELVKRYEVPWHEKTLGQLFCDGSSRAILDMLLAECERGGVEIILNARGIAVEQEAGGGFHVSSSVGEFSAEALVVATGGLSIPKLGATGLGYELARQFGLAVIEPRPALVPLVLGGAEAEWTALAGVATEVVAWAEPGRVSSKGPEKNPTGAKAHVDIAASSARLKSCPDTKQVSSAASKAQSHSEGSMYGLKPVPFREKMLVTHRGLSGPAVLQASSYWQQGDRLVVDFVPGIAPSHPFDYAQGRLYRKDQPQVLRLAAFAQNDNRAGRPGFGAGLFAALRQPGARRDAMALRQALRAALPQRLAHYLAEIGAPQSWSNAALEACEQELRRWEFHPIGTEGFEKAEVTAGGVDTSQLQARTMEARTAPGLYFIGEVVDVTGQLGGFNFQWAWASGVAAGRTV